MRKTTLFIGLAMSLFTFFVLGHPSLEKASADEIIYIQNYAVKPGDTLGVVLDKFNIGDYSSNILSATEGVYDFTSIKTGNLFQFVYDGGFITEIRYDLDRNNQVVAMLVGERISVEEREIEYQREQKSASNVVNRSLFEDAQAVGVPDGVILNMAEIFAWDIDFAVEIREGDAFSVVYDELYRDGGYVGPGKIAAAKFVNQGKEYLAFYYEHEELEGAYYDADGRGLARQFLKSPLNYSRISSGFSYNRLDPVTRSSWGPHRAIDYAAPIGTPVSVTGGGRVTYAGWSNGLGYNVKVDHGGVYSTVYAHLSDFSKSIRRGSYVEQGQIVGYVGSTGYATGPHLHYEMYKYGNYTNPLTLELPPGQLLPDNYLSDFQTIVADFNVFL